MTRWLIAGLAVMALLPACTRHVVEVKPIEIKPIHITMDINVKIQKEIANDFAFQDEVESALDNEKK